MEHPFIIGPSTCLCRPYQRSESRGQERQEPGGRRQFPTHHSRTQPLTTPHSALRIIPHPPRMGCCIQTFCLDRLTFTLVPRPAALSIAGSELMFIRGIFPQAQVAESEWCFPVVF